MKKIEREREREKKVVKRRKRGERGGESDDDEHPFKIWVFSQKGEESRAGPKSAIGRFR